MIIGYNTKKVPVTDLVIQYFEAIPYEQGIKIENCKGRTKFHFTLSNEFQECTMMMKIITKIEKKMKMKNINMRSNNTYMIMKW